MCKYGHFALYSFYLFSFFKLNFCFKTSVLFQTLCEMMARFGQVRDCVICLIFGCFPHITSTKYQTYSYRLWHKPSHPWLLFIHHLGSSNMLLFITFVIVHFIAFEQHKNIQSKTCNNRFSYALLLFLCMLMVKLSVLLIYVSL